MSDNVRLCAWGLYVVCLVFVHCVYGRACLVHITYVNSCGCQWSVCCVYEPCATTVSG